MIIHDHCPWSLSYFLKYNHHYQRCDCAQPPTATWPGSLRTRRGIIPDHPCLMMFLGLPIQNHPYFYLFSTCFYIQRCCFWNHVETFKIIQKPSTSDWSRIPRSIRGAPEPALGVFWCHPHSRTFAAFVTFESFWCPFSLLLRKSLTESVFAVAIFKMRIEMSRALRANHFAHIWFTPLWTIMVGTWCCSRVQCHCGFDVKQLPSNGFTPGVLSFFSYINLNQSMCVMCKHLQGTYAG